MTETVELLFDLDDELEDGWDVPTCWICGCTDDWACDGGCWWVPDFTGIGDLCSTCEQTAEHIARQLERLDDAHFARALKVAEVARRQWERAKGRSEDASGRVAGVLARALHRDRQIGAAGHALLQARLEAARDTADAARRAARRLEVLKLLADAFMGAR